MNFCRPGKSLRASPSTALSFLLPICPLLTCISQLAQSLHGPFLRNRKFLLLSLPSYLSTTGYRLFHSRPSQPICPLLTCVSQSAQFLHSPFLQNGKFLLLSLPSSLQLHHIANLDDRLF